MRPLSKRRQKISLTSVRLSIEPKGEATRTAPISLFGGGGHGGCLWVWGIVGAQGTLCDCGPTPAPCGEGGVDEIGGWEAAKTSLRRWHLSWYLKDEAELATGSRMVPARVLQVQMGNLGGDDWLTQVRTAKWLSAGESVLRLWLQVKGFCHVPLSQRSLPMMSGWISIPYSIHWYLFYHSLFKL